MVAAEGLCQRPAAACATRRARDRLRGAAAKWMQSGRAAAGLGGDACGVQGARHLMRAGCLGGRPARWRGRAKQCHCCITGSASACTREGVEGGVLEKKGESQYRHASTCKRSARRRRPLGSCRQIWGCFGIQRSCKGCRHPLRAPKQTVESVGWGERPKGASACKQSIVLLPGWRNGPFRGGLAARAIVLQPSGTSTRRPCTLGTLAKAHVQKGRAKRQSRRARPQGGHVRGRARPPGGPSITPCRHGPCCCA
jgi:hypothetical protein